DAAPAPAVAVNPVNESSAADDAGNDNTIDVSRSDAGRNAIDDRAFEWVAEGYAAYQRRDFRSAERFYEQALTIEANHRDALLGIAAVYGQTDRESLALDVYRKVLQIEPGNTMAASAILLTRAADTRWDNESDLKLLLQQFPDAHHLHFALGTIYVGEQRWAAARHAFQSAWQLAPSNANYAYNLAVSLERLGDVVEAARYYETALAYADDSSNVDRAAVETHLGQLAIIAREDR
ncbi:MAG: tetratricopeptide repeat protein, partial [Gammaproteobacteria bacterium]|nr:tetratricopeptide repeat protein [Gammaproteobacteria bacterium]